MDLLYLPIFDLLFQRGLFQHSRGSLCGFWPTLEKHSNIFISELGFLACRSDMTKIFPKLLSDCRDYLHSNGVRRLKTP